MIYEHACAIVTAAVAPVLRALSKRLDPAHCDGMFTVGLNSVDSAIGAAATHFINNGHMPALFIAALKSPSIAHRQARDMAVAAGTTLPFTLAQVTAALAGCSITNGRRTTVANGVATTVNEGPHELMARLDLQFLRTTI